MKIVNKEFHDYYDGCMGYGIDETIIYDRKKLLYDESSIEYHLSEQFLFQFVRGYYRTYSLNDEFSDGKNIYNFNSGYIAFCGKIINFIKCEISQKNVLGSYDYKEQYFYDLGSLKTYLKNIKFKPKKYKTNFFEEKLMHEFFKVVKNTDVFFEFKNPIFANIQSNSHTGKKYKRELIMNPKLEDFQFYGVYDSYSCFQEISMFLSGVLGDVHPPIDEISDEVKKHKHGFGHKYAFKKEPENLK